MQLIYVHYNFSRFQLFIVFITYIKICNCFVIACDFKNSNFGFGDYTTCEPRLFDTTTDKFVSSVIAWPLNRQVDSIRQLYIERGNTVYFPANLHKYFPHLEVVKLYNSRVKFLDNFDFRFLTALKFLNLEQNDIEVLQSDLFLFNLQLLELHLQKNKLKFIGARLLLPLMKLKIARFNENVCIDESADNTTSLTALKRLLDDNCASPEFLVKKNAEFIKRVVESSYTIADLTSEVKKLDVKLRETNSSLIFCENENESLNDKKFKVEMKLRKESVALRKAQSGLRTTTQLNDDLTVENVKLNNELKLEKLRTAEAAENSQFESYNHSMDCQNGGVDVLKLKFDNNKLVKENQLLKAFKDEVEKEWRSVSLSCEFVIWSGYACQANSLKVRTDDSDIMKVDGKHEGRKTNFDVKTFVISSQDVRTTFLPVNIGSIFPRLENLIAQDSKVVFIKRRNFDDLNALETLALDHNQIEKIPSDAFSDLETLLKIDLSHNKLKALDRGTFKNLKKLKVLIVNNNQIEKLSASLLKFNNKLAIIAMENNNIKYIGNSMLKGLENLKLVNFDKNVCIDGEFSGTSLKEIDVRITSHCTPPTEIYCNFGANFCKVVDLIIENENTRIMEIHGTHQRGKSNNDITELSILNQNVPHFPLGFGKFMKNLKKIFVKNSMLTAVDENDFESMNQLMQLTLSENEIQVVSEEAFQKVKASIEVIDLSGNKITQLEEKTFKNLMKLKVLKMNGNKIEKLSSNLFIDNVNLEEVFLNKNVLKSIGPYIMNSLRKLRIADFTENTCIDQKFPEMQLQTLKLKILEQCQ